ncbi:MAG TPA: hypothetical protein PKB03_01780 [Baekduia sp.]|nr:hypothetical protein [Baekduia sp.]
MGLFGKPRELKRLDERLVAGRIALSMIDRLPEDQQQRALATVPGDIVDAAGRAASAGHADGARAMLTKARETPPQSSAADRWPAIIDGALAEL